MYCDISNIKNIIPEQQLINLTNDEPAEDTKVNENEVNAAINHADEIINCYLRTKYSLPLKFIPPVIEGLSADIACYRLYKRRPGETPEHIKESYKDAVDMLNKIQTGKMLLDMPQEHPEDEIPRQQSIFLANKTARDKIFDDEFTRVYRGRP